MDDTLSPGSLLLWASWTSELKHMPHEFHSTLGFSLVKNRLHAQPLNVCQQLGMVLGIGLAHRDIHFAIEIEPNETRIGVPEWVHHSPLTVVHAAELLEHVPPLQKLAKR